MHRLCLTVRAVRAEGNLSHSNNGSSASKNECFFHGDKKMHAVGTKWHPYLPPFGFDRCSLCSCEPDSLQIECKRSVTCPPLMCEESEAFRENPMDCCKRCPVVSVRAFTATDLAGDQRSSSGTAKGPNELLASGGKVFRPCRTMLTILTFIHPTSHVAR